MGAKLVVCPDSAAEEVHLWRNYMDQTWIPVLKGTFRKAMSRLDLGVQEIVPKGKDMARAFRISGCQENLHPIHTPSQLVDAKKVVEIPLKSPLEGFNSQVQWQ